MNNNIKIWRYFCCINYGFAKYLDLEPIYIMRVQFRHKTYGYVKLFIKEIRCDRNYNGEEEIEFLKKTLEKYVDLKTKYSDYEFVPYEEAEYNQYDKNHISYHPDVFYSEKQRERHEYFEKNSSLFKLRW